jgi:hypothetical protein
MRIERCMAPQVWVHRVGCCTTISQEVVCSSINYFATLVVNDSIFSARSNKPSRNALYVGGVKLAATRRCVQALGEISRSLACHLLSISL